MSQLPKLLVATTNAGKLAEITAWLSDLPYEVICLNDLPNVPEAVEETGETFAANALLKAQAYYQHTGWLTLSDDSGLTVNALGGRPGVHSARYAGAGATDAQMVAKLLDEMQEVPDDQRQAQFVCVVALCGTGVAQTFKGSCAGEITRVARGANGFGYDPIFLEVAAGKTFAELTQAEKALLSHRGRALTQVRVFLTKSEHKRIGQDFQDEDKAGMPMSIDHSRDPANPINSD